MRVLNSIEAMTVAGGRAVDSDKVLLDEVIVRGRREPGVFDASVFVVGAGNSEGWSGTTVGERGGGGHDEGAPQPDQPCINDLLGKNGPGAANMAWGELFKKMSSDHLRGLTEQISKLKSDTFPLIRGMIDNIVHGEAKKLLDTMIEDIKKAAELPADERSRWGQNFADQLSWLPSIVAWQGYMDKFLAGSGLVRRCG